jgi:hypothetical protein
MWLTCSKLLAGRCIPTLEALLFIAETLPCKILLHIYTQAHFQGSPTHSGLLTHPHDPSG